MHTTNYHDTFIEVAEDCPASIAEPPPRKDGKITVANIEFDLIAGNPYRHTSDDVVFHVYATRNDIADAGLADEREAFFSKGRPCLRSSALAKRYGWGIHSDAEGRVALVAVESPEYQQFASSATLKHLKAMRSKRALSYPIRPKPLISQHRSPAASVAMSPRSL